MAPGSTQLCDHAGVLLFAPTLIALRDVLPEPSPLLSQWLASLLLGALNIEQTKYLNANDLSLLLGPVTRTLSLQRDRLYQLATEADTVGALLRWNFAQLDAEEQAGNDFYLDPHTQHYTGSQQVLKGWCAAIRWADKLINSDYVHSAQGTPIYFECGDNYEDLRTRLFPLLKRLRSTLHWDDQRVLTFVIDRGIYGNEVFTQMVADPRCHLITWEKNYTSSAWSASTASGHCTLEKSINDAQHTRHYHFAWREQLWSKNSSLRQIEVIATNPSGRIAHVSILSDDLKRPVQEIVVLMFSRWVQENDFKYLDKHFGINQLTSYRSSPYEQLRGSLTDRQVPSQQWQAKQREGKELQKKKARLLQAADAAQRQEQQRQQRLGELAQAINPLVVDQEPSPPSAITEGANAPANEAKGHANAAMRQEQRRLKQASQRQQKYAQQRAQKIDTMHRELEANQAAKASIGKSVSRIDALVEQQMVRMDTSSKTLMDTLRIIARNVFYRSLESFKQAYNNYRDDHDHWRELTRSMAVLHVTETVVEVHLIPRVNHPPKLETLMRNELEKWNAKHSESLEGSGRRIELRLAQRDDIGIKLRRPLT